MVSSKEKAFSKLELISESKKSIWSLSYQQSYAQLTFSRPILEIHFLKVMLCNSYFCWLLWGFLTL
jgi:hypothetical protein